MELYTVDVQDLLSHMPSPRVLLVLIPLYMQAMLLQPKQTCTTRILRIALIPICIYLSIQVLRYDFVPREPLRVFNFLKNLALPICIVRTLEWGLVNGDEYDWIGLEQALEPRPERDSKGRVERQPQPFCSVETVRFATSLMTTQRGLGWSWGIKGCLIPRHYPEDQFLAANAWTILRAHIVLLIGSSLIQYGGIYRSDRFLRELGVPPFLYEAIVSRLAYAITFGAMVWNMLELGFAMAAMTALFCNRLASAILPEKMRPASFDVRAWPPMFKNPLNATSLDDWWTYRWHSGLRRTYIVAGYKPAHFATQWLGKSPSAAFGVLGAFLCSGIVHEIALYFASNGPLDKRLPSIRFFLIQGMGLVAERVFTQATGKEVGGIAGRIWLLLALGMPGAELAEAWIAQGLFNNQVPPHTWELWRFIVPMANFMPRLEGIFNKSA